MMTRTFTVIQHGVPFSERPGVNCVSEHPRDGLVYVTGGQYEVNGRISNFWYWRKLNPDGTLGAEGHGYGW